MTGSHENKNYDWAFDLRAFNCDSPDNDSDNDGQLPLATEKQNEMLLEDFDLGSREESVSYKPNPFSIAKINAAYRSARNGGSEAKSSLPHNRLPGKDCGLVQTRIDDILKKKQKSGSLKKAEKGFRPGASYEKSETKTKQTRPKIGPSMDRAFFRPQNVENSDAKPDFSESSIVRSGCSPSLEPNFLSENAHILVLSHTGAPSLLNDEPAWMLPSPSDNQHIIPDSISPLRDISLFSSPMRFTVSKLDARSTFPKHESPQRTPLSTLQHNPGWVERRVDHPPLSNSDHMDQKCPADHQVKQEFCHSSEISALRRTEEDVHLSHASAPFLPNPRNRDRPLATNSGPTPFQTDHISKRQIMAQVTSPVVPLKRNVRDAYNFSAEDPDANWSTLPTRKKRISKLFPHKTTLLITYGLLRNHPTSFSRVTKSFRLPGLFPPQKIVKTEAGETRVVTYLPPPLIHPVASRRSCPISRVQEGKVTLTRPSLPSAPAGYPSPGHPRISRLSQIYSGSQTRLDSVSQPVLAPTREQVIEVYRPPSPPTSDPPDTSSKGADVRIQVDLRNSRQLFMVQRDRPQVTTRLLR